jgi:DNA-3-methyladenine glycosylase II
MDLPLDVTAPFSLAQSLAFLRRFVPCQRDFVLTDTSLTAAVTVEGRTATFTIVDGAPPIVRVSRPEHAAALLDHAAHLIGARDDLAPLYEAAAGDPPFQLLVDQLHGLHHVRFLTLQEIAAYSVMMQRNPITRAAAMKRRFMAAFGRPIDVAGTTLHALPSLDDLAGLDGAAIGDAIGHRTKGEIIAGVLAGVARIGEPFLREAPYEEARDRLLAIKGIGPFSAAAILLRGLGRMDEVPDAALFEEPARWLYGAAYDERAIRRRYGRHLGTWSFYLKTGVARLRAGDVRPTPSRRRPARTAAA